VQNIIIIIIERYFWIIKNSHNNDKDFFCIWTVSMFSIYDEWIKLILIISSF